MSAADAFRPILTPAVLTKFELAKLVGILVLELQENKTSVADDMGEDLYAYAVQKVLRKEYDAVISRFLPCGGSEDVHLQHLSTDHLVL